MTVSSFYKLIFGQKVYKISLDGGCTCPNRDGTVGTGGCIFCSDVTFEKYNQVQRRYC